MYLNVYSIVALIATLRINVTILNRSLFMFKIVSRTSIQICVL